MLYFSLKSSKFPSKTTNSSKWRKRKEKQCCSIPFTSLIWILMSWKSQTTNRHFWRYDHFVTARIMGLQSAFKHRCSYSQLWRFCGSQTTNETTCLRSKKIWKQNFLCACRWHVSTQCIVSFCVYHATCSRSQQSLAGNHWSSSLLYAVIATRSTNCASVSVMHTQTFGLSLWWLY